MNGIATMLAHARRRTGPQLLEGVLFMSYSTPVKRGAIRIRRRSILSP